MINKELFEASELRFRRVIEANADGIIIVNKSGIIRYANPAAEKLFGRSQEELVDEIFGFPILVSQTTEINIFNDGATTAEMRVVSIDWQEEPAYLASLRDITERKQAEQALQTRERFLTWLNNITRAALETPDFQAMLQILADRLGELFNADGCYITVWDDARKTAVPGAVSHLIQPHHPIIGADENQTTLTAAVLQAKKAVIVNNIENSPYAKTRTAKLLPIQSTLGLPLIAGEQKLGAAFIIFKNHHTFTPTEITQAEQVVSHIALALAKAKSLKAERQQRQLAETLSNELEIRVTERTQKLREAYEQLKELDQLKSKFIDDISHELRTPLTNLVLYLDLMEKGQPTNYPRYLEILNNQTQRLKELVQSILRLSQLDLAKDNTTWTQVNLNDVAVDVYNRYQHKIDLAQLKFKLTLHTADLPVQGNYNQLVEITSNIVENAIKYSNDGEIHLQTFPTNSSPRACLQIEDSGMGIATEDIPYIFDRFYRGQGASQSNVAGVGLGLTIAESIVNLHNGDISVTSQPNQGTRVQVRLPLSV